jgi:hypothetical protein
MKEKIMKGLYRFKNVRENLRFCLGEIIHLVGSPIDVHDDYA